MAEAALAASLVFVCLGHAISSDLLHLREGAVGIKFLLTVNDTWDPNGCIATAATPMLISGRKYNESEAVQVGNCDHGPLEFYVQQNSHDALGIMYVNITFHSSVIEDAVPPSCIISWDGSYLDPTTTDPRESPLPSCWTRESREGYHMTYFWFRLLEWVFF